VASKIMPIAPFPVVIKQRERASARRLQLDRIPLYQIHQPNPLVPDSVIMPGMRSLLDSGDIGAAHSQSVQCRAARVQRHRSRNPVECGFA
jgi:aryl-alcohol dehydrogenase-like predicted oxidoreductase